MKAVKTVMMFAGAVLAAGAIFAAEGDQAPGGDRAERRGPPPAREGMRPMREGGGMGMYGNWVGRFLEQEENLDKLGIEGDARKKLVGELGEVSAKIKDIQEKIREAGMEQGRLMRETMDKPGADIAPVLAKVKEIGDLRTEQSILSTKVLAIVRDNLTKEQHQQVRELLMKEGRQRMEARREFNGNMERRRPQFEGGREGREGRPGRRGRGDRGDRGPREGGDRPAEKPAEK